MVAYAFNAQQYQPQYGGSGSLPVGPNGEPQWYTVVIDNSEQVATKDQQGGMLKLTLKCIDGPFTGVTQVDNLNLHNKNPQAVEIANKQLSAYCHVTGQFVIQDTLQLHGKPFKALVGKQRNNPEYTEIQKLADLNGNEPGKAGSGSPVAQPSQVVPPVAPPAAQPAAPAPAAWAPPPQGQPPAAPAAWQQPQAAPPAAAWGQPAAQPQPAPAPQAQPQPAAWGAPAQPPAWGQPQQ